MRKMKFRTKQAKNLAMFSFLLSLFIMGAGVVIRDIPFLIGLFFYYLFYNGSIYGEGLSRS